MINRPIRPFDVEILLDKICAVAIDGIDKLFGLPPAFAAGEEPRILSSLGAYRNSRGVRGVLSNCCRPTMTELASWAA